MRGCARAYGRRRTILEDTFIQDYVEDLLRKIRTQVRRWVGTLGQEDSVQRARGARSAPGCGARALASGCSRSFGRHGMVRGQSAGRSRCPAEQGHAGRAERYQPRDRSVCCCPLTQVLLKLIQPYTRVRIPFISKKLNVPEADVEGLLVTLILDGRLQGHIDQVGRRQATTSRTGRPSAVPSLCAPFLSALAVASCPASAPASLAAQLSTFRSAHVRPLL